MLIEFFSQNLWKYSKVLINHWKPCGGDQNFRRIGADFEKFLKGHQQPIAGISMDLIADGKVDWSFPLRKLENVWVRPPKQFIIYNPPNILFLDNIVYIFPSTNIKVTRKSVVCVTSQFAPAKDFFIFRSCKISIAFWVYFGGQFYSCFYFWSSEYYPYHTSR